MKKIYIVISIILILLILILLSFTKYGRRIINLMPQSTGKMEKLVDSFKLDTSDCKDKCYTFYEQCLQKRCSGLAAEYKQYVSDPLENVKQNNGNFPEGYQGDINAYGSSLSNCQAVCLAGAKASLQTKPVLPTGLVTISGTDKVCQIFGDTDLQTKKPTLSLTETKYGVWGTDGGLSFAYQDKLFFTFGDSLFKNWQPDSGVKDNDYNDDVIGYVPLSELVKNECFPLNIEKTTNSNSPVQAYVVKVNGGGKVTHGIVEVPHGGFEYNGQMYVFFVTNVKPTKFGQGGTIVGSGRGILAKRSQYKEGSDFEYVYDLVNYQNVSMKYPDDKGGFIGVSPVIVDSQVVSGLPKSGKGLLLYGFGFHHYSRIYLAYINLADIEKKKAVGKDAYVPTEVYYYVGLDSNNKPIWSKDWENHFGKAAPLFNLYDKYGLPNHYVDSVSVAYDEKTGYFYMLHSNKDTDLINTKDVDPIVFGRKHDISTIYFRYAKEPWLWSEAQKVLAVPDGYGKFIHQKGMEDGLYDSADAKNQDGRAYAPGLIQQKFKYDAQTGKEDIYFTLSTGNPYTVVLIKSTLQVKK